MNSCVSSHAPCASLNVHVMCITCFFVWDDVHMQFVCAKWYSLILAMPHINIKFVIEYKFSILVNVSHIVTINIYLQNNLCKIDDVKALNI